MKTKVTYIISLVQKSVAFEWTALLLNKEKVELSFILIGTHADSELYRFLVQNNFDVLRIPYNSSAGLPRTFFSIFSFLKKKQPHAIHCHLFEASVIGLLAGRLAGVKKRIYTRHHSSYHLVYHPRMVWLDKLCNRLATDIVAVSGIVKKILIGQEGAKAEKVQVIHHGFDTSAFNNVSTERIEALRKKYNKLGKQPVIGVISRYIDWKGIQHIIPAFKKILVQHPNALLVLANAKGKYGEHIHALLQQVPEHNYVEITFENDIFALYKLFDIFIHVPVDEHSEAFGQVYLEAMLSHVPGVFTRSGIAADIIEDRKNAWVAEFNNSDSIANCITDILADAAQAKRITQQAHTYAATHFAVHNMIAKLERLYDN